MAGVNHFLSSIDKPIKLEISLKSSWRCSQHECKTESGRIEAYFSLYTPLLPLNDSSYYSGAELFELTDNIALERSYKLRKWLLFPVSCLFKNGVSWICIIIGPIRGDFALPYRQIQGVPYVIAQSSLKYFRISELIVFKIITFALKADLVISIGYSFITKDFMFCFR